jgi:hypothetical protein
MIFNILGIPIASSDIVISRENDVGMFVKLDRNLTDNEKHQVKF